MRSAAERVSKQESIRRATVALDRVPKLSPVTSQLVARLSRRNVNIGEVAELIERDPMLCAQILQIANSAFFGRILRVDTIREALTLIGLNTIRRFALARSLTNLFSRHKLAADFSVTRFNLHSAATATVMELLVDVAPLVDPEDAFLAGMFHDVGKLLMAAGMPDEYEDILGLASLTNNPQCECEREILGLDHAELSAIAIRRWELGESILRAVMYHHDPTAAEPLRHAGPNRIALSVALNKADAWVDALGMSVLPPRLGPAVLPALQFDGFSFDETRFCERFEIEWKTVNGMFN